MKVLAIKNPWAQRIANGDKTIEVRSRNTLIEERVAIYVSRTKMQTAEAGWMRHLGYTTDDSLRGHIIGTVEMCGATPIPSIDSFISNANEHLCPAYFYKGGQWNWHLKNPIEINPITFKMPKGAVIWTSIEDELIENAKLPIQ